MSVIDTHFADPTSLMSPWQRILFQQIGDRELRNAALRSQLDATTPSGKTPAELRADISRYNTWLEVTPVQAGTGFANWVRARKAEALAQLADLTAGGAA